MMKQYVIKTISGGIVQAKFTERKFAYQWMLENNFDEDGVSFYLYVMTKE